MPSVRLAKSSPVASWIGKRVHVAAQQDGPRRIARGSPFEQGDEAAGPLAVTDRQRQVGQRRLQLVAGARAIEPKFGIGMDRPAKRDR